MKIEDTPKVIFTDEEKETIVGDEEELLESDYDLLRIPRSGKRQLMPIERLR